MKVVLLENIPNLGQAGDVVEVKSGFGRNYLLPRHMAKSLTKKAAAEIEEIKRVVIQRADKDLALARELGQKLGSTTVKLEGKVGGRGSKLYGSVTTQQIATAIYSQVNVEIDKRKITLPEPIRTLGLHNYTVRLHADVVVNGKVEVVKPTAQE
jgi:large subunit ribosomal protein L9